MADNKFYDPYTTLFGKRIHPDAPAGGGGPGFFISPGPINYSPSAHLPHPNSPAARYLTVNEIQKPPIANQTLATFSTIIGKPWQISDSLLSFLGTWENGNANGKNFANQTVTNGFILTVYNDSRNLPTIGCGHLVVAGDNLRVGDTIKIDVAKDLLKQDLKTAQQAINDKVNVPLYQYEYDALVSIAFNTGRSGVLKLTDLVNTGKYDDIPEQIVKYRTGGGNDGRRYSESQLFKSGIYDATH
jgi:lysozyme